MITYSNVLKAINSTLKNNFPEVKRPSGDIKSGFKTPAFFVQLMPITENDFNGYSIKFMLICIYYFSDLKTNEDNMSMVDKLSKVFKNKVNVEDRILEVSDKKIHLSDNVLQFKFNLEFMDCGDYIEINTPTGPIYLPEEEIKEELGYTPEAIALMEELYLEESEGD